MWPDTAREDTLEESRTTWETSADRLHQQMSEQCSYMSREQLKILQEVYTPLAESKREGMYLVDLTEMFRNSRHAGQEMFQVQKDFAGCGCSDWVAMDFILAPNTIGMMGVEVV